MFEKYLTKTGRLSITQPQEIKNQWYIQKCKEAHGDAYDYSEFFYKDQNSKSMVICPLHGAFLVRPQLHIAGSTCPSCQNTQRSSATQYLDQFTKIHGTTYTYDDVQYINQHTKVQIGCKVHGSFMQTPSSHLQGHGCPKCQNHRQDTLYVLKCLNTGLTKIGITGNLRLRLISIGGSLKLLHHVSVENPRELEKHLHDLYKQYRIFNPTVRSGGTEFFNLSDSQVQEIEEIINNVGTITT